METLGIFGFVFGLLALAMAAQNGTKLAALARDVEMLKARRSGADGGGKHP